MHITSHFALLYYRLLVVSVLDLCNYLICRLFSLNMELKSDASTSNSHSKLIWKEFQLQGWENTERHSWMMKMSRQRREIWEKLKQPAEWIDWQTDWDSCSETNIQVEQKNRSFQLQFSYLRFELKADVVLMCWGSGVTRGPWKSICCPVA